MCLYVESSIKNAEGEHIFPDLSLVVLRISSSGNVCVINVCSLIVIQFSGFYEGKTLYIEVM